MAPKTQATSDRIQQLQELFIEATEVSDAEREEWLRARCSGRPELLDKLKALLVHHDRAHDPLERGLHWGDNCDSFDAPAIGGYEILREIGRGGQAVVFEGRRNESGSLVAIKMLLNGFSAERHGGRRFRREHRVLGRLKHPHIVSLHEYGETEDGLQYLVMDRVYGVPVDQFSPNDACRVVDSPLNERLRVFVKVVNAVDFAHRIGIIHRDLKPSNILVDRTGEPRILDFGLAKLTSESLATNSNVAEMTESGQFVGSLPWASPEQVQGKTVDIRSDVYSLGVIFYQLITGGCFPYRVSGSIRDVMQAILHTPPALPSQIVISAGSRHRIQWSEIGTVGSDTELDSIALKALAKSSETRFQSAAKMSAAIDNYLDQNQFPENGLRLIPPRDQGASPQPDRLLTTASSVPTFRGDDESTMRDRRNQREEKPDPKSSHFGRFELLDLVGTGGFGQVFKARDPQLNRIVALKIPHHYRLADQRSHKRFIQEAQSLAQVRHEAIVPIHEAGEIDNIPYLVSEFVEGETLEKRIAARRPSVDQAVAWCIQLSSAVHHAHEVGIVHRDIKPGNVMLDENDQPYLMDFGLAKQESAMISMSATDAIIGTPAYMSPEQVAGETVDIRSDVYSLGVTLYQMLTGELPFRGRPNVLIYQILNEDPRQPRRLNDRVPRDLEMVCLKAMGKEPSQRYATAMEFCEDLRRFATHEPVAARPTRWSQRSWLWCRHPDRIGTASTITIAMALMLATWEVLSLIFVTTGIIEVESRMLTAATIIMGFLFFGTLALLGYLSRRRTKLTLWSGAIASIGLLLFSIGCLLGFIPIEGLTEKPVRMPVFSFFTVAAGFIVGSHAISLIAFYSNRNIMRWSGLPRPFGHP